MNSQEGSAQMFWKKGERIVIAAFLWYTADSPDMQGIQDGDYASALS